MHPTPRQTVAPVSAIRLLEGLIGRGAGLINAFKIHGNVWHILRKGFPEFLAFFPAAVAGELAQTT